MEESAFQEDHLKAVATRLGSKDLSWLSPLSASDLFIRTETWKEAEEVHAGCVEGNYQSGSWPKHLKKYKDCGRKLGDCLSLLWSSSL